MKLVVFILLFATASCQSAPPSPPPVVVDATAAGIELPGPFEFFESLSNGGHVERMHTDGTGWAALVKEKERWTLIRIEPADDGWKVVQREPASEYYLWPTQ